MTVIRRAPTRPPQAVATETILHVEDSESIRSLVAISLERDGYTVLSAASAASALHVLERRVGEIDLMLTDIVMPGMNGRELADLVIKLDPDVKVLFTSGYPWEEFNLDPTVRDESNFIEKPFLPNELADKIRAMLDSD